MKRRLPALLIASLWTLSIAPLGARADGAGIEALGRLIGTWESSATSYDTAYSKAATTTATTTCAWAAARTYVVCEQAVTSNGTTTHDVAVYTYDTSASKYRFYATRQNGVSDVDIAVDATTITYSNEFNDGPRTIMVRTLNVWSAPDRYQFWTEFTKDGGKDWNRMLAGSAHRLPATSVSPPPGS